MKTLKELAMHLPLVSAVVSVRSALKVGVKLTDKQLEEAFGDLYKK